MKLDELEKIALAATPGPWEEDFMLVRKRMETYSMRIASVGQIEEDTRYIATFNPETVLKMIDKLKRYERLIRDCTNMKVDAWIALGKEALEEQK